MLSPAELANMHARVALSVFADLSEDCGTTNRAKGIARLLQECTDLTVVSIDSKNRSPPRETLGRIPNARQLFQLPFWLMHLISVAPTRRWHLVMCSNDWYGFFIWYFVSRLYGYPIVFDAHGIISEEYREWGRSAPVVALARLVEKFVAKHSQLVICPAERVQKYYRGLNPQVVIVPLCVDTDKYLRIVEKREELRRRYGVSEYTVVGLIGPFDTKWNEHSLDFLYEKLDAFSRSTRFMVIGKCPRRIKDERVIYTGYVQDYIGHLSCLDIALIPRMISTSGPLNKILEPMSCCLPVLTTSKATVGLDHATNGNDILVVREEDLVEMTNRLVCDRQLLRRLGKNARETVEKNYSVAVTEKKLIEIVYSILRNGSD